LDNFIFFPQQLRASKCWLLPLSCALLVFGFDAHGQSLRKQEQRAINRTHLTFVNGDTVQRFTVTYAKPTARTSKVYYWQGPTQILRTTGAYNGHLLTGDYQLTTRNGNLLGKGNFDKGLKTGEWRTWRLDGTPVSLSNWRRGRQWGKTRYYNEAGRRLRPSAAPQPAEPGAAAPATLHFWQPIYWQGVVKRVKQRRADKQQANLANPAPAKKIKTRKPDDQPREPVPVKKVKPRKTKAQPAPPGAASLPQGSTP
jgi:hypothetical protein